MMLSFISLLLPAIFYSFSTHYIASNSIKGHMRDIWHKHTKTLSAQAGFLFISESNGSKETTLQLFDNPLIIYASVRTQKQLLYSSNLQPSCSVLNIVSDAFMETDNYWCFNSITKDYKTQQILGSVLLVISKKTVNKLIRQNLNNNLLIITFFTIISFGASCYFIQCLTGPLQKLSLLLTKNSHKKRGADIEGTLELRSIQKSINLMLLSIEQNENQILELSDAHCEALGASQIKSDILRIVSHEMKSPLHSAQFYLHLMKSGEGSFVTDIMNCLDRLKKQIDNLLNYSQASENKITLNKAHFFPKRLLQNISEEYATLVNRHKNQLKINCLYQYQIHSDEQLIKQIIYNLIDNAIKHCDRADVTIDCHSMDNHLIISVTDTGCGISKDNLENIFIPFWQVNTTSSIAREGSGLGLSICQLFAESLGGNISVTSKVHYGTVFTLSIPYPEKHH